MGIIAIFVGITLILGSCSSGNKRVEGEEFELGVVNAKVACLTDETISYALYIPSNYNSDQKFPVVFAFDAHAKGIVPVELFQEQAEKYGYIIVGSNNSQNGLTSETTLHFYEVMSDDVLGRLSIDRNRIYTAGFSGGSRVASSVAIFKGGIAGVIGCSAGFPALSQPIQFRFDYIGYVGDEDMNYLEMVTLQDALQQSGYRHHLVVFSGTHDWPPKDKVEEAFIWMEANAMKDLKRPVDKTFVEEIVVRWNEEAMALEKNNNKAAAFQKIQNIISFFDGLSDMRAFKAKLALLETSAEVAKDLLEKKESSQKEMSLQTQYIKALNDKSAGWWREEIKTINNKAEDTGSASERLMLKRLLGYLSLAAYSNANGFLNAGQLEPAARYIELYAVIDPQNNEHAYLAACLFAKKDQPDKAFASLDQALALGYSDINRFQNDTVLARLKGDTRYFDFLQKLR